MKRDTPNDLVHEWDDQSDPPAQLAPTLIALGVCVFLGWIIAAVTS
jgi:hypothetical protein